MVGDVPFLAGVLLGLSLAAPPGPVLALMLRRAAEHGAWASVAVGLGATTADAGFLLLALAGAVAVLAAAPALLGALSLAGAGLLAYYAANALGAARRLGTSAAMAAAAPAGARTRAGFAAGFLAAATSPFNFAWWLGPGTALIATAGLALVAGMFAGIVGWVLVFSHASARLGRRVRRFHEGAAYASAVILAAFAAWIGWRGLQLLGVAPA